MSSSLNPTATRSALEGTESSVSPREPAAATSRPGGAPGPRRHSRWVGFLLWTLAVLLMLGSAVYQRRTGPTHPLRGELVVGSEVHRYRLIRSEETVRDARVALPAPGADTQATVFYRRYPLEEPYTPLAMAAEETEGVRELVAYLPAQPAAGKLEYYIEVESPTGVILVPAAAAEDEDSIVMRFKDPVPTPLLVAHVLFMFFGVLIGMRAGLGALFAPWGVRRLSWITFGALSIGGMVLGPFVQKYAFGEYWTGFPWGYDLTDNKTLIMWLAWAGALFVLARAPKGEIRLPGRAAVLVAAAVMTVVYLIPHSLRGSELDYEAVDRGVAPSEAIGTSEVD